jgi:hypothetical protein
MISIQLIDTKSPYQMEGLRNKILLHRHSRSCLGNAMKSWHFVAVNDIAIGCGIGSLDTAQTKPN